MHGAPVLRNRVAFDGWCKGFDLCGQGLKNLLSPGGFRLDPPNCIVGNAGDFSGGLYGLIKTANLVNQAKFQSCLLYTSDAADDSLRVDLGGRRIIKKPNGCSATLLAASE